MAQSSCTLASLRDYYIMTLQVVVGVCGELLLLKKLRAWMRNQVTDMVQGLA